MYCTVLRYIDIDRNIGCKQKQTTQDALLRRHIITISSTFFFKKKKKRIKTDQELKKAQQLLSKGKCIQYQKQIYDLTIDS